jgi:hypothetical protein
VECREDIRIEQGWTESELVLIAAACIQFQEIA